MKIRRWYIFVLAVIIFSCTLYSFWTVKWKPYLLISKTRYGNMLKISWGLLAFENEHERLPANLKEVVTEGFLPFQSSIYACPMQHNSLMQNPLSYENCEYLFLFKTNSIEIRIAPVVFRNGQYSDLPEKLRKLEIQRSSQLK